MTDRFKTHLADNGSDYRVDTNNPHRHPDPDNVGERAISNAAARAKLVDDVERVTRVRAADDSQIVELIRPLPAKHELIGVHRELVASTMDHVRAERYRLAERDFASVTKALTHATRHAQKTALDTAPLTVEAVVARSLRVEPSRIRDFFDVHQRARTVPCRALLEAMGRNENSAATRRAFSAVVGAEVARNEPTLAATRADWFADLPRAYEEQSPPRWYLALSNRLAVMPSDVPVEIERLMSERLKAGDLVALWWLHALRCRVAVVGGELLDDPDELKIAVAIGAIETKTSAVCDSKTTVCS